ncbi:hypothetical protein TNCT_360121 [Trichonephila clavata]|uniref:Uncharacterized protein n=1 Tax=Trichonephila clavata TaxID=2740835 RepID=A0A8X6LRF7_TRICU|nr:hypothetical protein TNCT_360121 [Trichonephila clavata]
MNAYASDSLEVWHIVGRVIKANNFEVDLILPGVYAYYFKFVVAAHFMNNSVFARNGVAYENKYARGNLSRNFD